MKQLMKKGMSLLLAFVLILGLVPAISLTADAATVNYRYSGSYIYNWGTREEVATFLSPNAEDFYEENNVTYAELAVLSGSSNESSVPSSALYKELASLMSGAQTKQTSYNGTRDLFQYTDCENNGSPSTISSFYSGVAIGPSWDGGNTWNREHTWPNSKGDKAGNGENDIMMLRPASVKENSSRGNKAYGESGDYYNPNGMSSGKHDLRGDVARIVLYVYVRWGCTNTGSGYNPNGIFGTKGVIESKELLLDWVEEDPVDTWELGRNDSVESITGTRNVFVDFPELAFLLFDEQVPAMQTPSGSGGGQTPDTGITIDSQPVSLTVNEGEVANFTVAATGTKLTYQWQYRTSETDTWKNSPATGNKTATLSVPGTSMRNGYQYRCAVTNAGGKTVYTDAAILSVNGLPILVQPVDADIYDGQTAQFAVTAEGENLSYQWYFRTSSTAAWAKASAEGNQTATLTVPGTTWRSGYQYYCQITDADGKTAKTNVVTLTVNVLFLISVQPVDTQVTEGAVASFTVTATGLNLTYQWQYRTSETDTWKNSPATGNKTATLSVPGTLSRNGYQYRCVVTDGTGSVLYTDAATLTVKKNWESAVDGWSLTLKDDIGVNFSLKLSEEEAADTTVSFTVDGVTTDIKLSDVAADANGNYVVSVNVAAAQMNDNIELRINGEMLEKQYSVRAYAEYILDDANGFDEKTKSMVTQMLHYGAAAQTLFDYNAENPVNAGIADNVTNEIPADTENNAVLSGKVEGISVYAVSMSHDSKIALRYYFQVDGDIAGYTFKVGEQEYPAVYKEEMYFVEVGNIDPDALDESVTLEIVAADGSNCSVTYGPMNYIVRQYHKTENANLKAVLQQLYDYYLAAEAFVKDSV